MSNESDPPPLRLKPRLRPDSAPATGEPSATVPPAPALPPIPPGILPVPAAAPPPPAVDPASGEAAVKMRLKPKLSVEPSAPAAPTPAPPPPAGALTQPPSFKLKLATPVAPPDQNAPGGTPPATVLTTPAFKLKPKVAAPPASSGNTAPAAASLPPAVAPNLTQPPAFALKPPAVAATPATPVSVPPPPPVGLIPPGPPGSAPVAAKPPTAPPPKLHLTAAPFAPEASLQPKPPAAVKAATLAARNKAGRKRILILGGTAALVLVAAVLFLWQTYFSSPPAPPPRPAVATTTPKPAPAPASVAPTAQTLTQTAQNLAAQPGQAVTNIQTALADARGREQARVDAVLDGKDPPDQRALNTPPPGTFTPQGVQAGPNGPPAAVGNPPPAATPPVAPASTIAFRAWVDSVKIGGVNGTGTLAFINGQTHRPGDMLDSAQGIVFDSADPAKKVLVFRDRTGAVVQKKY